MADAVKRYPLHLLAVTGLIIAAFVIIPLPAAANPGWQIMTIDSAANHRVGMSSSIALDSSGRPHISYTYTNTSTWEGGVRYASYNGTAWSTQVVVPSAGNRVYTTSLALDSLDKPHISFYNHADTSYKYASYNGTAWQVRVIESGVGAGGDEWISSIATDNADKPHVSFFKGITPTALKYASYNGTAWNTEIVDSNCASANSLAFDSSGLPHISYNKDTSGDYLWYASYNGTAWNTIQLTTGVNWYTGRNNYLAIDSSDYPHISHTYQTSGTFIGDLQYNYKDTLGWHNQTVDSTGDVGYWTSLALDSADHPHISYIHDVEPKDQEPYSLKYASYNGSAWKIETVDTEGGMAATSLGLDSGGYPHISYYYVTGDSTGDLKYARYVPAPGLSVSKGGPASAQVGENITYWVAVSNTGDLPLQKISVSDNRSGVITNIAGLFSATLAAGACENRTYTYKVKMDDGPGPIVNRVTAVYGCSGFPDLTATDNHSVNVKGIYGYVGVGVVSPQKILHVLGSGFGTVPLFVRGTDSAGFIIERTAANRWVFGVNELPVQQFVISTFPTGSGSSVPRLAIDLSGNVTIPGSLSKGGGSFKIDHPLGPADKYLLHSFVESPDMLNIYSGSVLLDGRGEASVELPSYFRALNRDYTYQVEQVGGFAPLYVSLEADKSFRISGGRPGMKVSWQVTGIRHDPYAEVHPVIVEQHKPVGERGFYLHPLEWGKPGQGLLR